MLNEENKTGYNKMQEMPIPRLILGIAVPAMLSMLIISAYNLADAYFVAKLGTSAVGAIGVVVSITAMIQAIGFTIGMGAGSVISRLLGEKDEKSASKMAMASLFLGVISGVIFGTICFFFRQKLLICLGASKTILPYAMEYVEYILYATPISMAAFVLNNLLRAEGKTKYALIGIAAGGIVDVALDPVLIFWADMGIAGAALATASGQVISVLVLLFFYLKNKTVIKLSIKKIPKEIALYKVMIKTGSPSFFRQGLASVSAVALNYVAVIQGDDAVAAMSIVNRIFMIVFCTLIGFGQGFQPVAGYNYGAGNTERVRKSCRFTLLAGTIGMTFIGILVYWQSEWLVRQFSGESAVVSIANQALRFQCVVMPFLPLGIVCNMVFQAAKKPVVAAFLASCRQGVFFLPCIFLFPRFSAMIGIEVAQPVADLATFFVCLPFYRKFLKKLRI